MAVTSAQLLDEYRAIAAGTQSVQNQVSLLVVAGQIARDIWRQKSRVDRRVRRPAARCTSVRAAVR